jgi:ABC-type lipoprotein export system ATPase subunit
MKPIIDLNSVTNEYGVGNLKLLAVIILGLFGAGKLTILNLLGGINYTTDSTIYVDGKILSYYRTMSVDMFDNRII